MQAHLGLSGEPQLPQCFVAKTPHMNAAQIADLNVRKRRYQKSYLDYWHSTSNVTRSGRPVDAIICPTAPHAAVIPGRYRHVGYTSFVNVLDLTSAVIPITHASKELDQLEHDDMGQHSECECEVLSTTRFKLKLF